MLMERYVVLQVQTSYVLLLEPNVFPSPSIHLAALATGWPPALDPNP
jgi:hypothetical protein